MDWESVLTPVFAAIGSAGLTAYFMRQLIKNQISHSFDKKLEKLKSELDTREYYTQELLQQRLSKYPNTVELIYKLRNKFREIINSQLQNGQQVIDFNQITDIFIDHVFASRLVFQRDNIFLEVHEFKNEAIEAKNQMLDVIYLRFVDPTNTTGYHSAMERLNDLYNTMNDQHTILIEKLTKLSKFEALV